MSQTLCCILGIYSDHHDDLFLLCHFDIAKETAKLYCRHIRHKMFPAYGCVGIKLPNTPGNTCPLPTTKLMIGALLEVVIIVNWGGGL